MPIGVCLLGFFSPTRPSGPSWSSSYKVSLRVVCVLFVCLSPSHAIFLGLSLPLWSHDQFEASHWSALPTPSPLKFWKWAFCRKIHVNYDKFKIATNCVNQIFNLNAFFLLTGATWYYHTIYLVFTYFASFTDYEDGILKLFLIFTFKDQNLAKKRKKI